MVRDEDEEEEQQDNADFLAPTEYYGDNVKVAQASPVVCAEATTLGGVGIDEEDFNFLRLQAALREGEASNV